MEFTFTAFGRLWSWKFFQRALGDQYVTGVTNRCADGRYCLFLDYDNVPLEWVMNELVFIGEEFSLGDLHIFETGNGYHVVSTEKRPLRSIVQIMRECSIDNAYLEVPLQNAQKQWTLRLTEKNGRRPRHIGTIYGRGMLQESRPHNELLRKIYKLPIPKDREDAEEKFYTAHYQIKGAAHGA